VHKVSNKIECNNMHGERIKNTFDYLNFFKNKSYIEAF